MYTHYIQPVQMNPFHPLLSLGILRPQDFIAAPAVLEDDEMLHFFAEVPYLYHVTAQDVRVQSQFAMTYLP